MGKTNQSATNDYNTTINSNSNTLVSTCSEMKQLLNKEQSINNYSIKQKHVKKLNCFFASKNFELVTDMESMPDLNASKDASK